MSVATTTAIAIAGSVAAAGAIGGAAIGAHASHKAAQAQVSAADNAAALQKQEADDSLNFQKKVYGDQQANQAPYLAAGKTALDGMSAGLAPGGQFTQNIDASNFKTLDPGYDFRLSEGMKALERSEAAGGSVGSGGAMKAGTQYAQDYASGEFNNAYSRFMNTRQSNYNNLASIAGLGQTATQNVNTAGTQAAGNVTNINSTAGSQIGSDMLQAGNATASGYMGAANAWGSALNGIGNDGMSLFALTKLLGKK